jgi:hypothetical protein
MRNFVAFLSQAGPIQREWDTICASNIDRIDSLRPWNDHMTVNGCTGCTPGDASRRSDGRASFAYYYGYISVRAEMV